MNRRAAYSLLPWVVALAACTDDRQQAADTAVAETTAEVGAEETAGAETSVVAETSLSEEATGAETSVSEETTVADTTVAETVVETQDETDIGPLPEPTPFNPAGVVDLIEQYSDGAGAVVGTWIRADFGDHPAEYNGVRYVRVAADGGCETWKRPTSPLCDPACADGSACVADDTCDPYAARLSAGTITVTGAMPSPITLTPNTNGAYAASPDPSASDLFAEGATLSISASGADVAAFTATVEGVSDLHRPDNGLVELIDGKAFTLKWNAANDGSTVETVLQLGWHGLPATSLIICRAPDAEGQVVVTPAVIAAFDYFGGEGLFQVPSWMDRIAREVVPTARGAIVVTSRSRQNLYVTHAAAAP